MKGFVSIAAAAVACVSAILTVANPCTAVAAESISTRCSISGQETSYSGLVDACRAIDGDADRSALLDDLTVLDYGSYLNAPERGLAGRHAFYLVSGHDIKGSADPLNIIAFARKRDASDYQQTLGGEVMGFEDAWKAAGAFLKAKVVADTRPAAAPSRPKKRPQERAARREHPESSSSCNT
jgi:hypothetical protein